MTEQRRSTTITLIALIAMAIMSALMFLGPQAHGATVGDRQPNATYGATNILASAATKAFTCLQGRNAFSLFNNGPNNIWCGVGNAVATTTGYPVLPQSSLSLDLVCMGTQLDVYCIASTADQSSPANTRYIQVK